MSNENNNKPKVSVVISAFNQPAYLCLAIDSILAQTYQDFEIVVVDDGSSPAMGSAIEHYGDRVRYFYQENQGPTRAENFAISQARGEYIASIDQDDIWLPEMLARQVEILDKDPDLAFVCCAAYVIDSDGKTIKTFESGKYYTNTFADLFDENFVIHSTVVLRKSCCDDVGVFDVDFYTNHDHELWLRLAKKYSFYYHPSLLAKYRIHDNNITKKLDLWLNDSLRLYKKSKIIEGVSFFKTQKAISKTYYKFGQFYSQVEQFQKAAVCFLKSVMHYPLIGVFYWPHLTQKMRFTLPYRVVNAYLLIIINYAKALRQYLKKRSSYE